MRLAPNRLRILAFSSIMALAACGGSGGKGTPDAAAGADGGGARTDGGAGAGGKAGAGGGTAGTGGGTAGAGGGTAGTGGGTAGAGGGTAGAGGGTAGAGGGTAGADGGFGGSDGGAPDTAEAGASDATEAGAAASGPCAAIAVNTSAAQVTNINNGKAIDTAAFTGGAIATGTYVLTSVVHFGATPYAGTTHEIWVVDAVAKTLEDATLSGTTATYASYTLSNASTAVLSGTPVCGVTLASNWNYLVTGTTLSVNLRGSSDVLLFSKI
jgi:hypothetical protein